MLRCSSLQHYRTFQSTNIVFEPIPFSRLPIYGCRQLSLIQPSSFSINRNRNINISNSITNHCQSQCRLRANQARKRESIIESFVRLLFIHIFIYIYNIYTYIYSLVQSSNNCVWPMIAFTFILQMKDELYCHRLNK